MTALADQADRNLIRTALDQNMVVEAAAGTGKTTELVNRIVALLAEGKAIIGGIVAVTFTEKAAGELKLRLRTELERARAAESDAEKRHGLENALAHLEESRISTIHAFCADLLRERPVEAGIDPGFEVLTEPQSKRLFRQAFRAWFQNRLEAVPEGLRRFLRRHWREPAAQVLFNTTYTQVLPWQDFPAPWRRDPFNREAGIDRVLEQVHQLAAICSNPERSDHPLCVATTPVRQLSQSIRAAEAVRARDYDGLEADLATLARYSELRSPSRKGAPRYSAAVKRDELLNAMVALASALADFERRTNADLAAVLRAELQECIDAYEQLKHRSGTLDFLDLLIRARNLVRDSEGARRDFQRRITHVLIDEFQDTDPLQAELLLLLASEDPSEQDWSRVKPAAGKLFVVGDPKQSIYRFRRADVGVYQTVRDLLVSNGALAAKLTVSFRSVPSLQNLVNAAFAPEMTEDKEALQAGYVPLSPYREQFSAQPSVIALSVPRPYGRRRLSAAAVEESLPDAVAAFVEWLVRKSGWTVAERDDSRRVAIEPKHICLLFRRFYSWDEDVARPYLRALEARGLEHLLVGGRSYHAREEVETLRSALNAIEWPDDELSVFATLKGSLFSIPDDVLFEYKHVYGRLHPFRLPPSTQQSLSSVVDCLRLLQGLHRERNYRPITETIERLLQATRAHAAFAMRPSGEQVLANVLHVSELARKYEMAGGLSFRGFVEQLREGADALETPDAPIFEEGSEGVRMMSVHKAKGLEFPVVILADITAKIHRKDPARYFDPAAGLCVTPLAGCTPAQLLEFGQWEVARDYAEGIRVSYVAATRARDLLVVPAVGDDPMERRWQTAENWWIKPLYKALYPPAELRRKPQEASACPKFKKDSVLQRPAGEIAESDNVCPGAHRFGSDSNAYEVVWWDPQALTLDIEPAFGIRQEDLLKKTNDQTVAKDLEMYGRWRKDVESRRQAGAVPSLTVRTATDYSRAKPAGDASAPTVTVVDAGTNRGARPGGLRFGALVHAVLATVSLDADSERIERIAVQQARIVGAPEEEIKATVSVVASVLEHPLLDRARRALKSGQCRRETPVTLLSEEILIEGVVDLAFLADGGWTVVDFKTDYELVRDLPAYKRQVALYAQAISSATGTRADAVLMRL
jgi:ATP-dependent helicase/nuclease subunit A